MRVRPRSGLLIRDPANPATPLPVRGAEVPKTSYWLRRVQRGDVELVSDFEELRRLEGREQPVQPEDLP